MPNMTNRSNRLRLVVKESGKTAKEIINTFDELEKNDRTGTLHLPKDPITISRHINAKRAFDIDMAIAYGKALDSDPADICFEPVTKNIIGCVDVYSKNNRVNWYGDPKNTKNLSSVRVPREFFNDRFKCIEFLNPNSFRHGMIYIYKKSESKDFTNPRSFNQLSLCQLGEANYEDDYVIGVPVPTKKNRFMITTMEKNIVVDDTKIRVIHPIVSTILPSFYDNYASYF